MDECIKQLRDRFEKLSQSSEGLAVSAQVTPGVRGSAFNLRADLPGCEPQAILVGVYNDGRIWSYSAAKLGPWASQLAQELDKLGIQLSYRNDEYSYWLVAGPECPYELSSSRVPRISEVVRRLFAAAGQKPVPSL